MEQITYKEKQILAFFLVIMFGTALVMRIFNIHPLILTAWVNSHPEILLLFLPIGLYFTLDKERIGKE